MRLSLSRHTSHYVHQGMGHHLEIVNHLCALHKSNQILAKWMRSVVTDTSRFWAHRYCHFFRHRYVLFFFYMCVCEFEKVRVKSVRYTYSKNDERCMRFVFPLREFIDHIEKGELECDCRWAGIYHITFTKEWVITSRSYIICAPSINLIRS